MGLVSMIGLIKCHWQEQLGSLFPKLEKYLIRTKHIASSYPCIRGCLREVRSYNGKYYGICTEDIKNCDDIILSNADIALYKFDVSVFTDDLLNKLLDMPLTKAVSCEPNDSHTYHVAVYDETDEFSKKLHVYFCLCPRQITELELLHIFRKSPYFVIFTLEEPASFLLLPDYPFVSHIINIHGEFFNLGDKKRGYGFEKRFADILSVPIAPALADQTLKTYKIGQEKQIEQRRRGNLRAKSIKDSATLRKEKIEQVTLVFLKDKPKGIYSASDLARLIAPKLKFKRSFRTLREDFSKMPQVKALLKEHHKRK